ncbi:hypothetical protein ABE096_08640 [Robertmurraya massiliosenegalensis]|uniref:hypothetical protein n=1 Tax=Robertmurraya TaxID=2837507 RepID=UPI0039A5EB34
MKIPLDLKVILAIHHMIQDAAVPEVFGREFPKLRETDFVFYHFLDSPYGKPLRLLIHIIILIIMAAIIKGHKEGIARMPSWPLRLLDRIQIVTDVLRMCIRNLIHHMVEGEGGLSEIQRVRYDRWPDFNLD